MSRPHASPYRQIDALTASPERLQLMLIEGAIRNIRTADEQGRRKEWNDALGAIDGAQKIILEILSTMKIETELVAQVADIYIFIFRSLAEASLERNVLKLTDALRILEIERDTWREVCQQSASRAAVPAPHLRTGVEQRQDAGLSLEG